MNMGWVMHPSLTAYRSITGCLMLVQVGRSFHSLSKVPCQFPSWTTDNIATPCCSAKQGDVPVNCVNTRRHPSHWLRDWVLRTSRHALVYMPCKPCDFRLAPTELSSRSGVRKGIIGAGYQRSASFQKLWPHSGISERKWFTTRIRRYAYGLGESYDKR